jgi:hypothetical protein
MVRLVSLTICVFVCTLTVMGQRKHVEDVVFRRDESVLRGKIIGRDSMRIRLQTNDGSVWVIPQQEVLKVEKQMPFGSYIAVPRKFAHFTELGPLVAGKTTIDGVTTAAFSFQTVNGYRFSRLFFAGAGVGMDLYATQTMIPLLGSVRGDLSASGNVIPFYFADAGYAVNITQNSSSSSDFKGGLLYAAGLGVKIPFNRSSGFLISLGYRYQASSYLLNGVKQEVDYKRLAIRAGFFL